MVDTRDSRSVAKWFVARAMADGRPVTNLKLQKLMYYAHGFALARTGQPLLHEPLQAWDHGPVAPQAYRMFSDFKSEPIKLDVSVEQFAAELPGEVVQVLDDVWRAYGGYSAWNLREMTHAESPWRNVYVEDEQDVKIPDETMRAYFTTVPAAVGQTSRHSRFANLLQDLRHRRDEQGSRVESGDLSAMKDEHEELSILRRQANSEALS